MIHVITPFQRTENLDLLINIIKDKARWTVLIDDPDLLDIFPDWVNVKLYDKPDTDNGVCPSNVLFNKFISDGLEPETQYMILCDDDSVEEGFFDKVPNDDVVLVSMKRSDRKINHVIWDDWSKQMGHWEDSIDILLANPKNIRIGAVGGEQIIIKGKILQDFRYGLSNIGDGEMILKVAESHKINYIPDAFVLFNYFEDGRYESFNRIGTGRSKPVVMFIGDYFCAGNPAMGLSEWEGNIWSSLESTGLAQVCRFHFDKYYYHTGKRADEALLERIASIKPDYIVLIIYKFPGQDAAVMNIQTLSAINVPIITIWGDLEAQQQRDIAKVVEPFVWKMIGTATKDVVESLGYKYMHVPKDPRTFNDPNRERDIDVVFSGSYGLGRSERQEALQYLIDNGVKLVVGGSEGRDHFSTEEYADRYKRAKISISFSKAHGINVVNARPFEVFNCGSMLIEQDSPELAKMYKEGSDYVVWKTKEDLLEKIRYYLANDNERNLIANNGYRTTQEKYSADIFWKEALNK